MFNERRRDAPPRGIGQSKFSIVSLSALGISKSVAVGEFGSAIVRNDRYLFRKPEFYYHALHSTVRGVGGSAGKQHALFQPIPHPSGQLGAEGPSSRARYRYARVQSSCVSEPSASETRCYIGETVVRGVSVDASTRCSHYHGERDVIAIRFACCDAYFPCHACHDAVTDHTSEVVPREVFDEPNVLCGNCGRALTVREYAACENACLDCDAAFNPGCKSHWDRYFAPR